MDDPLRAPSHSNWAEGGQTSSAVPVGVLLEQQLAASEANAIDAAIEPRLARALRAEIARSEPKLAIEIGMANGISTLAILAGLPPGGRLISIDPFKTPSGMAPARNWWRDATGPRITLWLPNLTISHCRR